MPSYAIKSSGIRQVAANSLIGNSTGSTGSAEELSATDAKTLLGLGTTDSPTFDDITATGQIFVPSGTSVNPSLCFTGAVQKRIGFYEATADTVIGVATGGGFRHAFGPSYIATRSTSSFAWSSTTDPSATRDLTLHRDDAGILAQRNGTNSQAFRIYNTDDGSQTNYERGAIGWNSNVLNISTEYAGTGTQRAIRLASPGASSDNYIQIKAGISTRMSFVIDGGNSLVIAETKQLHFYGPKILPLDSGSQDLGSDPYRWSNIYGTNADLSEALTLASHTPATTTNKLYNVGGTLYFNGASAGGNPFDQDLNTTDSPTFASATIGNMTLSDAGSYDSITSGDARLALRAQDGSMELYMHNKSDGNDSFRFNTANGIFELFSDADNQIDLRNGTSPNSLNIFNTWTDSSNYERASIGWDSNELKIQSQKGGTGSSRAIRIGSGSYGSIKVNDYLDNTGVSFYQGGAGKFSVRPSNLEPSADNNYGLGTSNRRWSSLYAASAFLGGDTVTASTPMLDLSQTWNDATVAFNGLLMAITNTASLGTNYTAGTSKAVDITMDGENLFAIQKKANGMTKFLFGNAVDSLEKTFIAVRNTDELHLHGSLIQVGGVTDSSGYGELLSTAATPTFGSYSNQLILRKSHVNNSLRIGPFIELGATDANYANASVIQGAGNALHIVGATTSASQSMFLYNTWTDSSNYERGFLKWDSSILKIGTEAAGTGTKREITIDPNSYVRIGNVDYYSTAGQIIFNSGNRAIKTGSHNGLRLQDGVTSAATTPLVSVFGPILTDDDGDQTVLSLTPTYNQGGTAGGTDILVNRTETAVGSGDQNFIDLQVGGTSKFKVDRLGDITTIGTYIKFGGGSVGRLWANGDDLELKAVGDLNPKIYLRKSSGSFEFSNNNGSFYLYPDADHALSMRNGTNAQTLNVYGSYSDASNYERGTFKWDSSILKIGTEAAGTGTLRAVDFIGSAFDFDNKTITAGELQLGNTGQCKLDFAGTSLYATGPEGIIFRFESDTTNTSIFKFYGNSGDQLTASSGVQSFFDVDADVNQSSTAGYTGIDVDVTETATGSGDKNLMDLKVGGSSKFKVDNDGQISTNGTISQLLMTPTGSFGRWLKLYTSGSSPTVDAQDSLSLKADGTTAFTINHGGVDNSYIYTGDVYFNPLTSMALGQHDTAIDLLSYGTYTDASNYERLKIESGTAYSIRVQAAGTGTGRDLNIHAGASAALRFGIDGTNYIIMTSSGVKPAQDLFPNANDSYKNGTTSNRWSETNTVDLNSTGDINFSGLPTSSSGLSTGDLYLQSSGVPGGDYQIMVKT